MRPDIDTDIQESNAIDDNWITDDFSIAVTAIEEATE